ncbi:MAG: hypothetical protein ACRDRS_08550 [Pseudonocardiaceae bacterium]
MTHASTAQSGGDDAVSGGGRLTVAGPARQTGGSVRALATLAPGGLDADWEPGLTALALGLPGKHVFADAINPGRHANLIPQLRKLGAVITETSPTECRLTGPQALTGATVQATDIRTGSALLIAALAAAGSTVVTGLSQLRRGHADLPGKLMALGARRPLHHPGSLLPGCHRGASLRPAGRLSTSTRPARSPCLQCSAH